MPRPVVFSAWEEDLILQFKYLLMKQDPEMKQFLTTNASLPWKEIIGSILLDDMLHMPENREWLVRDVFTNQQRIEYGF